MKRFSRAAATALVAFVIIPSVTQATTAYDALRGYGDGDVVTRGDLIRAAVQVLNLENTLVDANKDLPYRRIARGLEQYVRVAHEKRALEAFGYDLLLAQGITRGDALRVMVNLTGLNAATPVSFKDVRIGTPEESAVRVAIDRGWMDPIREDLFGVRRKLTGREAI